MSGVVFCDEIRVDELLGSVNQQLLVSVRCRLIEKSLHKAEVFVLRKRAHGSKSTFVGFTDKALLRAQRDLLHVQIGDDSGAFKHFRLFGVEHRVVLGFAFRDLFFSVRVQGISLRTGFVEQRCRFCGGFALDLFLNVSDCHGWKPPC